MKIEIRREKILRQLALSGKISVSELSVLLEVTPVTIRSDLTDLEREGKLLRVQGGAIPVPKAGEGSTAPQVVNAERKRAIGEAVTRLVRDGDTLFINSGTVFVQNDGAPGRRPATNFW